jgi:hypothetical protein
MLQPGQPLRQGLIHLDQISDPPGHRHDLPQPDTQRERSAHRGTSPPARAPEDPIAPKTITPEPTRLHHPPLLDPRTRGRSA